MQRIYLLKVSFFLSVSFLCFSVFAANTARIDVVRSKDTLADSDTEVIEAFLSEAFAEILAENDFSNIASLRAVIVSKSSSELESGQIQYGPRFFTVAQKQVSETFQKVSQMPDSHRKDLLTMNLLILASDLGNVEIAKNALDHLQSTNTMIRYWAVSCLTNNNILRQLNLTDSAENSRLAEQFSQKLQAVAQTEQSGDILIQLAQFASAVKSPAANEILNQIAQKRINLYLNLQAENEMVESWILKALLDRAKTDTENASVSMKNFAILYSLVVQKYITGRETLPETNIRNLISVIAQTEKYLSSQFLPDWPGNLKSAIEKTEKDGGAALLAQYDLLFGSANAVGKLPSAANFDYGKNPDGSVKNAPPTLQKPPQAEKPAETNPEKPTETKTEKQTEVQAEEQSEEQPENNK
jgi:hypothetical protein